MVIGVPLGREGVGTASGEVRVVARDACRVVVEIIPDNSSNLSPTVTCAAVQMQCANSTLPVVPLVPAPATTPNHPRPALIAIAFPLGERV